MGYVEHNLITDEQVVYKTTYHWIIFFSLKSIFSLFIIPMIQRATDQFAVTNKRIIIKTGLISRKIVEMNISKLETVNVRQSIMGRMLGYGSLEFTGTGGTKEIFVDIYHPTEFKKRVQEIQQ
ncbi:MAG: PH domain-containing protein [Cytophagaceae bacterium]|nr:PH domain-containing protein [Cytophagaceae bacterium]